MKAFEVNTTAWDEENLILVTNLTDGQIKKIIEPIVFYERSGGDEYTNDSLVDALIDAYPDNQIYYYTTPKRIEI
jgi:hypothetical protein